MDPLFLIDAYGIIYQAYFAFLNRPLYNPQGKNSQAVFGFFRTFFELYRTYQPRLCAVIMDSKAKTFRHQLFASYKAQRDATPTELHDQVAVVEEILEALGVRWLRVDGFEADDLLATLALKSIEASRPCFIVSRDKDILQLVSEGVSVLRQRQGQPGFELWGREDVFQALGVYPEQIVDYLALIGDQSDNVPGVKGIGPKTACKLLQQHKSLEGIYQHLDEIAPAVATKLVAGRENAFLSQRLVTLNTSVPLSLALEELDLHDLKLDRAFPLFEREGMKSLLRQLKTGTKALPKAELVKKARYRPILTELELKQICQEAKVKGACALDTETDDLDELKAELMGIALAYNEEEAFYIPLKARDTSCLPLKDVLNELQHLLDNRDFLLIGQNLKYDFKILVRQGLEPGCRIFDTMVAAWLLDSTGSGSYRLDVLADKYLGYKTLRYSELITDGSEQNLSQLPLAKVVDYAAEDAALTFRLYNCFSNLLKQEGLEKLFYDLEMPILKILAQMELTGIRVLPQALNKLGQKITGMLASLETRIYQLAGRQFNINSPKQLQEILFNERKLKPIKKIKTGYSTDNQVLEILALEDELPALILEQRALAKLKNTYLETLPLLINAQTKRIHTQFLQTGTATGRLASREPNLQNIPVRTELGRLIRSAFVPEAGMLFLSADYSQIELAVLAHLSEDSLLLEAFIEGKDIHSLTASLLLKRPLKDISPEERRLGKTINFGVIYGMSPFRLAQDFKISKKEASTFIEEYFKRYRGVSLFKDKVIAEAEKSGAVTTILGRRRLIPNLKSENRMERSQAERIAFNTTIQGSAADIVKLAMKVLAEYIAEQKMRSRLILQVHDELILEVPENELKVLAKDIRSLMENAVKLKVPLRVELGVGESWGELRELP